METSPKRTWDWALASLLVVIVLTAAVRLVATDWTTHLYFSEAMGVIGTCVGLALGASRFSDRATRWLGLDYTLTIVPYQMTILSEVDVTLAEKLSELGLRIGVAFQTVSRGKTVDDPILFILFITSIFWLVGLIGGYRLARHFDTLTALLPSGLIILVIQIYDSTNSARIWALAFYLFLSLLLMGRVYYLESRRTWKERRVFQMPETAGDLSRSLMLTAALVVLTTWALPLSLSSLRSATEFWREFVRPLRPLREDIARALDPLDSPYGARGKSDFYAETLPLGRGLTLSDEVVFRVQAPDDLNNPPPRYYWRGRVFSTYNGKDWVNITPTRASFDSLPGNLAIPDAASSEIGLFTVRNAVEQALIYSPGQPVWTNQPVEILFNPLPIDDERDLISLQASTPIAAREGYQVRAALINPTIEELQNASTDYPAWVTNTYLQLPTNFSPRITALADQITVGKETPYDKATAITTWLRTEINYQAVIPAPPANVDPLEWVLFDYKQSFCVYYATSEVLMLRHLGIPARMAVGFAQGELDEDTNSYTILRRDYHAWPEVYFPGIGWVEFEPTASQDEPIRPINNELPVIPVGAEQQPNGSQIKPGTDEPADQPPVETTPVIPWTVTYRPAIVWVSWIAILLALWGLDRRTGWVGRIPLYIEARVEQNGNEPPRWIRTWAAWIRLSPIGRAYETINLSLRILGYPQPVHITAAERAKRLVSLVPAAQARVEELTAQHEQAVYAGGEPRLSTARKAAASILLSTIQTRLIQLGESLEERFTRPNSFR